MVTVMENNQEYIAIPTKIAFDKTLTTTAKLLYGEIAFLCVKEGFCWATNGYLARLFNVDNRTIQRALHDLKEKGYIFLNTYDKNVASCDKIVPDLRQICLAPLDKNDIQKNKRKKNKNSISKKSTDFSAYDLELYEEMLLKND